jgi:hypothetical protein
VTSGEAFLLYVTVVVGVEWWLRRRERRQHGGFIADLLRSYLDPRKRRRYEAEAEAEAEAERRRKEIEDAYKNIDEKTRNRLRISVEERAKREYLLIGPGDLEAAVVRMYERSQVKEPKSATRE